MAPPWKRTYRVHAHYRPPCYLLRTDEPIRVGATVA